MRKTKFSNMFIAIFFISTLFVSCNQIGEGHTPRTKEPTELEWAKASVKNFATIDLDNETKFKMGATDGEDASVTSSYKIAKHEVTRDVWARVYKWATSTSEKQYRFSSKANIGDVTSYKEQPMVDVTYMDAAVWCNAYTEYLNFVHKDDEKWVKLIPVYYQYSNEARDAFDQFVRTEEKNRRAKYAELLSRYVLRVSGEPTNSKTGMEFNEFYLFNGYRLPTVEEWEFASRLTKTASASYDSSKTVSVNGSSYYIAKGLCLSGSAYSHNDLTDSAKEANKKVASNFDKLLTGPLPDSDNPPDVATKIANAIGCFDMSGGVWEWTLPDVDRHVVLKKSGKVFILDEDYPKVSQNPEGKNRKKGGSYLSRKTEDYAIGFVGKFPMKSDDVHKEKWQKKDIGFRLAKTKSNFF